ncbi:MAG: 5'-nucleotidase C-terminal domain-containing protein, partial [Candidatus Wallbacteria bacterium]|nr:5'-nucleotidase C-terminal domain-containing protein [Candidatus Wallbacteria bacterium]
DHALFVKEGVNIGVLGVCFQGLMRGQAEYEEYSFSDPVAAIESALPGLRSRCRVLILLSHLGFQHDCEIAARFPEIDLIIGGHTHTVIRSNHLVGRTLICHSGGEGNFLGSVTLEFSENLEIKEREHSLIELSGVVPDIDFRKRLDREKIRRGINLRDEVIGEALSDFITEKYSGETALGDFVSDLIRFSVQADLVFLNASSVNPILSKGPVTLEKLQKVVYWDNDLYNGSLTGEEIYRIFSMMLSYFVEDPYFFCYFSGVRIEFTDDPMCRKVFQNLEKLERIAPQSMGFKDGKSLDEVTLCDLCRREGSPVCLRKDGKSGCEERLSITYGGMPLVRDNFYSVVTTGFLINGGLEQKYSIFFEKYPFRRLDVSLKKMIEDYFRENKTLRYVKDNRLAVKSV